MASQGLKMQELWSETSAGGLAQTAGICLFLKRVANLC